MGANLGGSFDLRISVFLSMTQVLKRESTSTDWFRPDAKMMADRHVAVICNAGSERFHHLFEGVWSYLDEDRAFVPLFLSPSDFPLQGIRNVQGAIGWLAPGESWPESVINADIPRVNCGSPSTQNSNHNYSVFVDEASVFEKAIEHFRQIGLESVQFLTSGGVSDETHEHFRAVAEKAGLVGNCLRIDGPSISQDQGRLVNLHNESKLFDWLETLPRPSGILCENCQLALLAARAAEGLKIAVPGHFAILGIEDHPLARMASPAISTVSLRPTEVVYRAAQLVAELIQNLKSESTIRIAPGPLTVRESTSGTHGDTLVECAVRQIQRLSTRGLTVSELAAINGVSRRTLIKRFSDVLGVQPSAMIREIRVKKAKRLLRGTTYSLSKVATLTGFSSQSSFCNFFVRHAELAPSEYRKREGNGSEEEDG